MREYMLIFTHILLNETICVSKSYDYILYSNHFFDSYREFALLGSFCFFKIIECYQTTVGSKTWSF